MRASRRSISKATSALPPLGRSAGRSGSLLGRAVILLAAGRIRVEPQESVSQVRPDSLDLAVQFARGRKHGGVVRRPEPAKQLKQFGAVEIGHGTVLRAHNKISGRAGVASAADARQMPDWRGRIAVRRA